MTTVGTAGIQQQCVAELYRYVDKMEKNCDTVRPSVCLSRSGPLPPKWKPVETSNSQKISPPAPVSDIRTFSSRNAKVTLHKPIEF